MMATAVETTKSFFVVLSAKIGGWLGLILGASVLSFIELLFFLVALILECLSKKNLEI